MWKAPDPRPQHLREARLDLWFPPEPGWTQIFFFFLQLSMSFTYKHRGAQYESSSSISCSMSSAACMAGSSGSMSSAALLCATDLVHCSNANIGLFYKLNTVSFNTPKHNSFEVILFDSCLHVLIGLFIVGFLIAFLSSCSIHFIACFQQLFDLFFGHELSDNWQLADTLCFLGLARVLSQPAAISRQDLAQTIAGYFEDALVQDESHNQRGCSMCTSDEQVRPDFGG